MTSLQTNADFSHNWVPPIGTLGPDVGELTSPTPVVNGKEPSPIEPIHYLTTGKDEGVWWWTCHGLNNGYAQEGPQELVGASISEGEADLTPPRQATLPLSLTKQTNADADVTPYTRLSHTVAFGKVVINLTGPTETYLFGETSSTNPAIVAKTYAPGQQATGVGFCTIQGTNYLALLKDLTGIILFTDFAAAPAALGAMHGNTTGAEAIYTTPLGNTLIWSHLGSVWDLPKGAAYNSAPNEVLTQAAYGIAGLIGPGSIAGRQARVYLLGQRTPYGGTYGINSTDPPFDGQIESYDFLGTDRQIVDFGLEYIQGGDFYREGMIAHNGRTMKFRGRVNRTLNIQGGRKRNSDREVLIAGFYVRNHDELFLVMNEVATPNGSGNTKMWLEAYDWNSDSCTPITKKIALSTSAGQQTFACCRSLPISPQTAYLHQRIGPLSGAGGVDASWYRHKRPPVDQTPYDQRQTVGAGVSTGSTFDNVDSAGVAGEVNVTLPKLWFPGNLFHAKKTVTGAYYGGALEGTAEFKVTVGGRTFHFYGPTAQGGTETGDIRERSRFDTASMASGDGGSEFLHLQPILTWLQGVANTFTTPQPFPLTLWGRWYGPNSGNGWGT